MIRIRPAESGDAEVGDAEALVRCHLDSWREAYSELVDEAYFASMERQIEGRTRFWRGRIEDSVRGPWVAIEEGRPGSATLIGFADAGPGRDATEEGLPELELRAIYVRAAHWGAGVGHGLLQAAIGAAPAYLWVLADNARGLRFYRRQGFEPDGKTQPLLRLGLTEVRLVRR